VRHSIVESCEALHQKNGAVQVGKLIVSML
jgi:hypothetical protein